MARCKRCERDEPLPNEGFCKSCRDHLDTQRQSLGEPFLRHLPAKYPIGLLDSLLLANEIDQKQYDRLRRECAIEGVPDIPMAWQSYKRGYNDGWADANLARLKEKNADLAEMLEVGNERIKHHEDTH